MKTNRKLGAFITAALTFAVFASLFTSPVCAITGNYNEDGVGHPYVCLVGVYDKDYKWLWRGSGSLISPTIVLTAGHVTEAPAAHVTIWLDEKITYDPGNGYPSYGKGAGNGLPYTAPGFGYYIDNNGLVGFIANDVGIVKLDAPVTLSKYGELADVGTVDTLKVGTGVTFVGYGVQYQMTPKIGGPYYAWTGLRQRFFAAANLLSNNYAISSTFMKCSSNAAQGKGGTAFGDSGGPVLLGATDTILAVTSFGPNSNCAGVGYYCRVDTPIIWNWVKGSLV
jgi:Trypsin